MRVHGAAGLDGASLQRFVALEIKGQQASESEARRMVSKRRRRPLTWRGGR